jgi:hypothetical protein
MATQFRLPPTDPEKIEELLTSIEECVTKAQHTQDKLDLAQAKLDKYYRFKNALEVFSSWSWCYIYGHSFMDTWCSHCEAKYNKPDVLNETMEQIMVLLLGEPSPLMHG